MPHMHDVHLAGLDLNLLVALDALLAERHVTRAARRIGLSQSAMSHALSRIRDAFDDPMLVRSQEGMVPTERALALAPLLRRALGELSAALAGGGPAFDPQTSRRTFTIATADYAEVMLLPPLMARLRAEAPDVDIVAKPLSPDWKALLATGAIDLALGPAKLQDEEAYDHEPLLQERFLCIVRRGHPLTKQRLTVSRYVSFPHVMIAPSGTRGSFIDDTLAMLGKRRRVACMVPHFLVAPHIVARTDLVLTLSERIVRFHVEPLDLVVLPLPISVAPFTLSSLWHGRNTREPGMVWLRSVLREVAAEV